MITKFPATKHTLCKTENHRLLGSLGEYLKVTMEQPVEFMVLGEVETVEELERFYLQGQQKRFLLSGMQAFNQDRRKNASVCGWN